jgi:hypothetical protein
MRVRRLLGSVIATTLAATSLALATTSAPASAATPVTIVSGTQGKPWIYPSSYKSQPGAPVYGSSLSVSINVTAPGVDQVYAGIVAVQRLVPGGAWTTILQSDSAYLYDTIKVTSNASYRVLYSGGSNYQGTFDPATSAETGIKAQRKLSYSEVPGSRTGIKGKLSPAKRVKITVLKKVGKKLKRFKVLHSNRKGRYTVVLPAPRRGKFHWKIVFAGDRNFAGSVVRGSTYRR